MTRPANLPVEQTINLVSSVLGLGARKSGLSEASRLMGAIPELDSMAVVSLLTAIEEEFGITVDDDDLDVSAFETVGTLAAFIARKAGD